MKSVQRHNLETNWLAKHLKAWIDRARPHTGRIIGVTVAVLVVFFAWRLLAGASSARQTTAWDVFNAVMGQRSLNQQTLTQLNRAAEEYPDTTMQELADLTWADGQVWSASMGILHDRKAALSALDGAESTYQAIIDTSSNDRFIDRAHYGLARIYELRNDPVKARDEYLKVESTYAALAMHRAEELAKEKTKKTLEWLAAAEAPRTPAPLGAGTPGQRPAFDVQDFALPPAGGTTDPAAAGETSIEELFKGFNQLGIGAGDTPPNRYETGDGMGEKKSAEEDKEKSTPNAGPATPSDAKSPAGEQPTAPTEKSGTTPGAPAAGTAKDDAEK